VSLFVRSTALTTGGDKRANRKRVGGGEDGIAATEVATLHCPRSPVRAASP